LSNYGSSNSEPIYGKVIGYLVILLAKKKRMKKQRASRRIMGKSTGKKKMITGKTPTYIVVQITKENTMKKKKNKKIKSRMEIKKGITKECKENTKETISMR
jgi:hypothetical protein